MSRRQVTARVTLTVEIGVSSATWDEKTVVNEVHREAELLAVKQIEKLCERYVKIIGMPKVQAVITEIER